MRLFGIPQISDKPTALAAALTYWVFRCRDKGKSPAMGIKTWEYMQSSIKNAAIPSKTLDDYLEQLCNKLIVPTLKPKEWVIVINPQQTILRQKEDGTLLEVNDDQQNMGLKFLSWQEILNSLAIEGISDRHILNKCLNYPHIVTTFVRVRYEEDKAIGQEELTEEIEAETYEINQ